MEMSNSMQTVAEAAAKYARMLGASQIETEHLLYGILCNENLPATKLLNNLGLTASVYKKVMNPYLKQDGTIPVSGIGFSKSLNTIFAKTSKFCRNNSKKTPEIEDFLYIILQNPNLKATKSLSKIFKIDVKILCKNIESLRGYKTDSQEAFEIQVQPAKLREELPEALKTLGINLTQKVTKNGMSKIIGRDEETARVIEILCRKTKNNPVLIGEAGVGKSSVVEGLAQRIVLGEVPTLLKNKTIFSLDMASLMAGTKFRGSMEQRLKDAIQAIQENDDILVFIDEIHMLGSASSKEGDMSPADILKPYLARGEFHCIGATTLDEYRKYIEKDPALERRFQTVKVDEPTEEDTIKILKGIKPSFEKYHNVKISDDAINSAVTLSTRYITNRNLPDKAIDLIDEACSKARVNASVMPDEVKNINLKIYEIDKLKEQYISSQDYLKANELKAERDYLLNQIENIKNSMLSKTGKSFGEIGPEDIREVVSSWTGVPVKKLTNSEREKLLNLESYLSERVIGQPEAVSVVAKAIRRSSAGINDPKKPIGSFLFLGPTGVGKTELTKALADSLFDNEDNIVRFDMSEFMESHSVARLIGAPPGYVGHENGGELTEAVRKKPYSIVLFDEGRLTDSSGKVVNFKNTVIILTSNNGVQDLLARRKFEKTHPEELRVSTNEFLMNKLRDSFKPELLNRIDSVVIFDSLSKASVTKIADIMLSSLVKRLATKRITLNITDSAKELIVLKGYDELYGARPLKRVIDKEINDELANLILDGTLSENSVVEVSASNNNFKFDILC